ncbi:MAG TPA: hypothetical protein VGG39_38055 [Polyangiaceae bacterium]|jgi:hypothetical protein
MNATFSRSTFAIGLAAALACTAPLRLAHAQPAHSAADVAQARELFNQAMDLREKGDAAGALDKFRAAHSLAATPITGLELGRTCVSLGKLVEAREVFLSVGRIPSQPQETARSKAARKESADLAEQVRPRIPSVTVHVTGAAPDAVTVTVDGATVPADALVAPRLVDPGSHTIAATTAGGGKAEASVVVKEGEAQTVELKIASDAAIVPPAGAPAAPEPPVPSPAPEPPSSSGFGPLVYAGFGVAAAGLVTGTVTGILAFSKASSVKNACDGLTCPPSVDGDLHTGRTMGTVSTIAFVVAGAGAAAGVIGLLIAPHHAESATPAPTASFTPWIGPGSAGVSGRF